MIILLHTHPHLGIRIHTYNVQVPCILFNVCGIHVRLKIYEYHIVYAGQLVSSDYSLMQEKTLLMSRTINGSYCRISFYYYATSGITLTVNTPDDLGELWTSSESGYSPEQWNQVSIHITYSISDPRVDFALSFKVTGVGLVAIDDVTLHPCIDCQTGQETVMFNVE